jgi:mRNA deadenylase 3'-5' endonuclease subunit Ccr4
MHFDFRFPKIKAEILHSHAEVVVLQECDQFEEFYRPMLEQAGYRVVDCEKRGRDERLVIAFKNDVFQLVD